MTNNGNIINDTTTPKRSRSEQARINGAKSKGPKSAAGKCKISQNRMTHGFRSSNVVLCNEDREAYDTHLAAYIARYTPADKTEEDLVGHLAYNMWQIMRLNSVEVALFDLELGLVDQHLHGKFKNMDQYGRLAAAIKRSAGDNAFELLRRYKTSAERSYHRAYEALEEIRRNRPPAATNVQTNKTQEENSAVQTRYSSPEQPRLGAAQQPSPLAGSTQPNPQAPVDPTAEQQPASTPYRLPLHQQKDAA